MDSINCLRKSGDSSKPPITYSTFALVQSVFSRRVLLIFTGLVVFVALLTSYYLYLDALYLVDEVLEGTGPRELSIKEKLTIRVVAPRKLDDLNAFILEYSVCQPVQEIQVIWLHPQARPADSYFKYPHTHSKVTFLENYGKGAWDSMHGDAATAETESVLLVDPDVYISCSDIAFAQSVWRSSVNALVGFFPRRLQWQEKGAVTVQGWTSIVHHGQYSLLSAAGVVLRKEYLQSMIHGSSLTSIKHMDNARAHVREYVNQHPHCLDLAVALWPAATSALYKVQTELAAKNPDPAAITRFPSDVVSPPIWVDLPTLQIRSGVELSKFPHLQAIDSTAAATATATSTAEAASMRGPGHSPHYVAAVKVPLTPEMSDACATELVRLLTLTAESLPEAHFKSTRANSHIYW